MKTKQSQKHQKHLQIFFLLTLLVICSSLITPANNTYGTEGTGGDTGGGITQCIYNAFTLLCGDPAGSAGGGASWRIFETNNGWGLDDYTGYSKDILQDSFKNEAMRECSSTGWFASFGWDGITGSYYGYDNYNFQIGPARRADDNGVRGLIYYANYNKYNAVGIDYLNRYGFSNNLKIYDDTALELYQQLHPGTTAIPETTGYFCVDADHSLTAYAINTDGSFITDSDSTDSSGKITATTTVGNTPYTGFAEDSTSTTLYVAAPNTLMKNNTVYEFYNNWRYCFTQGRADGNCSSTERAGEPDVISWSGNPFDASFWSRIKDKSAYAVYIPNLVYGKSDVGNKTTDWQHDSKTADTYNIDCSPTSGCKVTFKHSLKRTSGRGSSNYSIRRDSNLWDSTRSFGVEPQNPLKNGTESFPGGNNVEVKELEETLTLYPGQVVCEKMTFNNNPGNDNSSATLTVCASAYGNAQPDNPDPDTPEDPNGNSSDKSLLNIKVKNDTLKTKYQREVYAKPTDKIVYRSTYNPTLQYTYYLKPQKMRIDNGTIYPNTGTVPPNGSTLATLFNAHKSPGWNNAYAVYSSNFSTGQYSQNFTFAKGDSAKQADKTNEHEVQGNEVGRSLNETAKTNLNSTVKTTPNQVEFTNNDNSNLANVRTTSIANTAYARIPYNFNNSTEITTGTDTPLFAGEVQTFDINLIIGAKRNLVTDGTYATYVKNAKWKLELCYNGSCIETTPTPTTNAIGNRTIGNLNTSYNLNGTTDSKKVKVNIPDVSAGTKICARSAVYPANSGIDTNWEDPEGSHTWTYSAQKCYTVAKKPSLEVWGGNVYTRGGINTSITNKGNLAGYNPYGIENSYEKTVFGSWTELGLIAGGTIANFSSGASLGYTINSNGTLSPNPYNNVDNNNPLSPNPGGSKQTSLCDRSPLTFANSPCNNSKVGTLGNSTAGNSIQDDKASIITKFAYGGEPNTNGTAILNDESKIKQRNIYHYYSGNESLNISGETVDGTSAVRKGTIQIVQSNKNINIVGNLIYENNYQNFTEMPKLVIYAKGNININCNVNRVDAILIADKNVKTCGDSDNINSSANANQLTINGAIISASLTPNRTYGAATGANSMIPAEIINFDPTLYLWGGEQSQTSSETSANLNTSYKKELPPRR